MSQGLPSLQDIVLPTGQTPPHRELYRRRVRMSRGASNTIQEPNMGLPTASSGFQAMLTPTPATHPGGTTLTSIGVAADAPRIVIPLPAALATAVTTSSGTVTPTPVGGQKPSLPTMLVDSEWFYPQSYPAEIQQFLTTSYAFNYRPSDPAKIVQDTQEFLRVAYLHLSDVGLDIKLSPALLQIFSQISSYDDKTGKPKHVYEESPLTSNFYLIMAYVVSSILFAQGTSRPLRSYSQVTYPGVIMASYVVRLTRYYNDLSAKMGITPTKPYLRYGGRNAPTTEAALRSHGEETGADPAARPEAYTAIPIITVLLFRAAQYATGRLTSTTNCPADTYLALQDAALNVPNLSPTVAEKNVLLDLPDPTNPLAQSIIDARCAYYVALITGKIRPDVEYAAVPGPTTGVSGIPTKKP